MLVIPEVSLTSVLDSFSGRPISVVMSFCISSALSFISVAISFTYLARLQMLSSLHLLDAFSAAFTASSTNS